MLADNNDIRSVKDLYNALKYKKYSEVRRICHDHPEYVLQKISVFNDTALHMAAQSKQTDLVLDSLKILFADCNRRLSGIKKDDGNTVLHEVATSDVMKDAGEELLKRDEKLLLTASNNLGEKPIFCAVRYGQSQMFEFLADKMELEKLSEEESKAHSRRNDGTTVLHISMTAECFGELSIYVNIYTIWSISISDIISLLEPQEIKGLFRFLLSRK